MEMFGVPTSWSDLTNGNILLEDIIVNVVEQRNIQIPGPKVKAELKTLVLFRFCSTPITWENLIFFRMKTARIKMRVKET